MNINPSHVLVAFLVTLVLLVVVVLFGEASVERSDVAKGLLAMSFLLAGAVAGVQAPRQ